MTPGWPDLVILGIVAYFAWKGFRNGFIAELAGPVAVILAVVAAFVYPGSLDADVVAYTHLGPGSSHAVGTVLFAVIIYVIVMLVAWLLGRLAKLPGINLVNGIGGALIATAKALLGAWAVLYVVLFFPLTPDLRADLHTSPTVQLLTAPDRDVDATTRQFVPWFIKPLLWPFYARHHA